MAVSLNALLDLSEELTCSICLCTFESPVTTPCGHNFCRFCLELTWEQGQAGGYSCPQCRHSFPAKPDLRKNTVLDTVVKGFLANKSQAEELPEEEPEPLECPPGAVPCDSCQRAAAAKTCLSCLASFCPEHLRPHLESQAFAHHRLHSPLGRSELGLRTCPDHNKLLEYYCQEHGRCLCCHCLAIHKACKTDTVQEAKRRREEHMKKLHATLSNKIENVSSAFDELTSQETKVRETVEKKKALLKEEFSEISTIIQLEELKVMKSIEDEEKRVKNRFGISQHALQKKKKEFENLNNKIETLLNEDDDIIFLMKATKLNDATTKDAYVPRIDCDHKLLHSIYRGVYALKELLRNHPSQNERTALTDDTFGMKNLNPFGPESPKKVQPHDKRREDGQEINAQPPPLMSLNKNLPLQQPGGRKKPGPSDQEPRKQPDSCQKDNPGEKQQDARKPKKKGKTNPNTPDTSSSAFIDMYLKSREEILKYAEKLTLDFNTAHKRILLTERNTKISVTDNAQNYSENPQRFTHCSQVLGFQGFSKGIHYWEVDIQSSNFCGIGVSYKSIERRGADSRLGRNRVSWCIEWFNAKLSAWHNDVEEILPNPSPSKVGVLLNCDEGQVLFFSHANKTIPLYKFQARFTEAVYPAFWVFSSNTTLALCPLK